jgi:transposase
MTLHPQSTFSIPEETARVAKAAFRKGNPYLTLRDEMGPIFDDEQFASLFEPRGRPVESPGFLALVSVVQYAENLSDRQVAEAVRSRIDLKYWLGLELTDPGFDYSLLSDFRNRLLSDDASLPGLFDHVLGLFKARGLLKERGKQRTDRPIFWRPCAT